MRAKERCTRGRESVIPNPVDRSAIETAVNAAKSASASSATAWLWIVASSSTPTPPLPPIPWIEPDPERLPRRAPRRDPEMRVIVGVGECSAAPADEQPERERHDHEPDRHLGALLDIGR